MRLRLQYHNPPDSLKNSRLTTAVAAIDPYSKRAIQPAVEISDLIGMLAAASHSEPHDERAIEFQKLPLSELIVHILETHHVFTKDEMTRLESVDEESDFCAWRQSS